MFVEMSSANDLKGDKMENREESVRKIGKMMGNAIRGEIEAEEMYTELSDMTDSVFLRERFRFLAREGEEYRKVLEKLSRDIFGEDIEIPDKSSLPLPDIKLHMKNGTLPLEELIGVLKKVKDSEKEAHDVYMSMSRFFEDKCPERRMLEYLAFLKLDRYYILERKIMKLREFGVV